MRLGRALSLVAMMCIACAVAPLAPAGASPASAGSSGEVRFVGSPFHVRENERVVRIMVERLDLPVSRLVVGYRTEAATARAGLDYAEAAGNLVFEVGVRSQMLTVSPKDDELVEEAEYLMLHLQTPSGGDASSRLLIDDDDVEPAADPGAGWAASSAPSPRQGRAAQNPAGAVPGNPAPAAAGPPPQPRAAPTAVDGRAGRTELRHRVALQQGRITPFELRPSDQRAAALRGHDGEGVPREVDPLLAFAAGLLLARVAAEVWFRKRLAPR